ncbi:MAG: NAD(P)H:quinone oxidoreductase [Kangiellaceae bacterium]|nr:NAD(P)H:quinone oxidoreductase [Kangiellaceae bacterium]
MNKILVLYYSSSGSTKKLAQLIARGIEEQGCEALLRTVPRISTNIEATEPEIPEQGDCYATTQELADCDALAFGSPTRFGNMAAPLKYFIDQTSSIWMSGKLSGKPVTFFSSSSSLHGGQESTLLTMMIPFLHHGMIISGIPYSETQLVHTETGGTPYGVTHWSGKNSDKTISDAEKELAIAQGKRIAMLANKLKI